jgi:dihydrofolate reductase
MRKFKLQVQTTVDGFMGGPNGELDWVSHQWSDDLTAYSQALHDPADCIVLGRKLAEGFIPAWAAMTPDSGETQESIDWMNNTPKVVISNSLTESPWANAVVAGGDLAENINKLKAEPGGDLITYGGSTLVQDLIAKGLLDELHLFVNPAAIGTGLPVPQRRRAPAASPRHRAAVRLRDHRAALRARARLSGTVRGTGRAGTASSSSRPAALPVKALRGLCGQGSSTSPSLDWRPPIPRDVGATVVICEVAAPANR